MEAIIKNRSKFTKTKKAEWIFLLVMLAVPIIHWFIFFVYVNLNSFALAFQTPHGDLTMQNFRVFWESLTKSGNEINIALKNTFIYFVLSVLVLIPGALIVSFFLYKRIFGYKFFRIAFYLPSLVSAVAMTTVFKEFIRTTGPLGIILGQLGLSLPSTGLLADPSTATATIVFYSMWVGFGGSNMLLFSGAMSRIPLELFEAAKLDGCPPGKEVTHLILPLIWPTITTLVVYTMTGFFNLTGPILLFTNGEYETTTISFWIFKSIYGVSDTTSVQFNNVAAMGLSFTIIGVPIILGLRKLLELVPTVEY